MNYTRQQRDRIQCVDQRWVLALFGAIIILVLAGCCPPKTIIREPYEVKVMVPVPCKVVVPTIPVWELDKPEVKGGDVYAKVLGALKEIEQRRAYANLLEAALVACTSTK